MSTRKSILQETLRIGLPLAILAVGIGGFVVFGRKPEVGQRDSLDDGVADVRTAVVKDFDDDIVFEAEGVAVPYRTLKVPAEVAGRITEKASSARSGRYVEKDETLFKIDVTDYKLETLRLEAQLRQSDEEIRAVRVDIKSTDRLIKIATKQAELRKQDLERHRRALRDGSLNQKAVDEVEMQSLNADNALQTLKNQLAALNQKIKTLDASRQLISVQLERAGVDAKRTVVKAPDSGTVITDLVEVNDYVKLGDVLLHINDSSKAEVKCNLRVEVIYWIWLASGQYSPGGSTKRPELLQVPKTPLEVIYEFQGIEFIWDGVLSRYEGSGLDEKTRTVPCRVLIENPGQVRARWKAKERRNIPALLVPPTLFSGMYVKLRIPVKSPQPLLEIPQAALRPGDKVWIFRDDKLRVVGVDVARVNEDTVLLRRMGTAGVQPGDKVVTSPLASVKTGMKAREVKTSGDG